MVQLKYFFKLFNKQVNKLNLRFVFKKYIINNTKPLMYMYNATH